MKMEINKYYYHAYFTQDDIAVSWKQVTFDEEGSLVINSGHMLGDTDLHISENISPIYHGPTSEKLRDIVSQNPETNAVVLDIKWLFAGHYSDTIEGAYIKKDKELRSELLDMTKTFNHINKNLNILSRYLR